MSNDTILVTGGAGFVGSHFARLASEAGREVIVLDDLSGGAPAPLPSKIRLIVGDIGDWHTVTRLLREHHVSAVAHFAGKIQVGESVRDPLAYFDVNLVRTLHMLHAVRDAGVMACLFSSTAAVYGTPETVPIVETARREPVNPYGATKLAIEFALEAWANAYGLRWAALRYFNAAGAHPDGTLRESHDPETHLIPLALDAGLGIAAPLRLFGTDYDTPDGTCIRDYIHVMDLASAHLAALARLEAGESLGPINLGTGRGFSVREVIDAARLVLHRAVPHDVAARRAGDPPRLVADPGHAMRMLGWTPTRSELPIIVEDALRSRRGPASRGTGDATSGSMETTMDTAGAIKLLTELAQLDFDASKTYEEAIEHVDQDDVDVRGELQLFLQDHLRHITAINNLIVQLGGERVEPNRDLKGVLLEGMTKMRSMTGTMGALKAMRMNEKLTNRSYDKALEMNLPVDVREVVFANLEDERRHLAAIEMHIERLGSDVDEHEEDFAQDVDDHPQIRI